MIQGQRTRLRRIERSDLPNCVKWLNDPEVRDGLAIYYPVGMVFEEQWFDSVQSLEPAMQPFAIEAVTESAAIHIGTTAFTSLAWKNSSAEVGIFIGDKAFWGRGFGTDALRALVRWGFDELNLHRVWLKVYEDNARAIRSYEKVGFRQEGRLRHERFHRGRYFDTLMMGLLRTEFEA
jgi:RimJ/RimL family protein N-acetyltransferase